MNQALRQRLVGALVLVALGVIFLPALFRGGRPPPADVMKDVATMPVVPPVTVEEPTHPASLPAETPGKNDASQLYTLDDEQKKVTEIPPEEDAVDDDMPPASVDDAQTTPAEAVKTETTAPSLSPALTESKNEKPIPKVEAVHPAPVSTSAAVAPAKDAPALNANGLPQAWALQVGVFTEKSKAESLKSSLQAKGYRAFMRTTNEKGKRVTRVLIGPEMQQTAIAKIKARVDKQLSLKSMIVKFES